MTVEEVSMVSRVHRRPAREQLAGGHATKGGCRTDETLGDGSEEQPGYLQEAPEEEVTVPHGSWRRLLSGTCSRRL